MTVSAILGLSGEKRDLAVVFNQSSGQRLSPTMSICSFINICKKAQRKTISGKVKITCTRNMIYVWKRMESLPFKKDCFPSWGWVNTNGRLLQGQPFRWYRRNGRRSFLFFMFSLGFFCTLSRLPTLWHEIQKSVKAFNCPPICPLSVFFITNFHPHINMFLEGFFIGSVVMGQFYTIWSINLTTYWISYWISIWVISSCYNSKFNHCT